MCLTLDSDTELPRGTAHQLIGALAHPLCQAIIDPERNIVSKVMEFCSRASE